MKLVYCPRCGDVFALTSEPRYCRCTRAFGQYRPDGLQAVVGGTAVPLGFDNRGLLDAVKNRPESGDGRPFAAFVIPKACPTVAVTDAPPSPFGS